MSDVLSWLIPVTVLIWASCEVICELSIGLVGSWFFSCVTSSCKNVFCRSLVEVPELLEVLDELDDDVPFMVSSSDCETVPPEAMVVLDEVKEFLLRCRS